MKSVMRLLLAVSALGLGLLVAAPPPWWTTQGVLTPATPANDYAAANLGQVKSLAAKAAAEMDRRFAANGGAGPAITSLVAAWRQPPVPGAVRNDFAAVNQGQLKAVAKLFYDRLAELGYQGPPLAAGAKYPWPAVTTTTNDYAAANLGQVKYLFSFDPSLVNLDADGNGLPDAWENQYLGHLGNVATSDPGGVGRTLLQSYQQHLSPWPAPTVASGLRSWFRASLGVVKDASNHVSQWTDLSGNGFHVGQTGALEPLWVAAATNSQPAVQFDGTTFLKTGAAVDETAGSNDLTVIAVAVPAATQPASASLVDLSSDTARGFVVGQLANATNQFQLRFMDAAQTGWNASPAAGATAGATQVITVVKNGTAAASYLNGAAQGTTTVPAAMLDPVAAFAVGNRASGNYGYNGQIAEVLVYNRALTDAERVSIEAALTAKYITPPFNPTAISGLRLHLRADSGITADSSGKVSIWADQSSLHNDAVQTTTGSQPAVVANVVNGRPVVRFDGNTSYLHLPNLLSGATGAEVFYVLNGTNSGPGSRDYKVSSFGTASTGLKYPQGSGHIADDFGSASAEADQGQPSLALNVWRLYNVSASATQWRTWLDGNPLYSRTGNTVGFRTNPVLGQGADGYNWPGDIAEILVYNRALTDAERNAVGAYLTAKYNLAIVPPGIPVNVTAIALSSTQVSLVWQSGGGNSGGTTYTVLRSTNGGAYTAVGQVVNGTSFVDTGLTAGTAYSYEIQAVDYAGTSAASAAVGVTTPVTSGTTLPTAGLQLWLKADAGVLGSGGTVSAWQDQSGNSNDAVQTTTGSQPVLVTNVVNGRPVVRFDGNTSYLHLPNVMAAANGGEIFYVLKGTNSGPGSRDYKVSSFGTASTGLKYPQGSGHIVDDFGSASAEADQGQPSLALNVWRLYNVSASATQWRTWLDGNPLYSRTGNTVGFRANPVLGQGADGYNWPGDIAEILVYNRALTDTERNAVGTYLTAKYGLAITVPGTPTNVSATSLSSTQVGLVWQSGGSASGGTTYTVLRSTNGGGYTAVGQVVNGTSFVDTGLVAGTAYSYEIQAGDYAGTSAASAAVSVTTPTTSGTTLPTAGLQLWLKADAGVLGSGGTVSAWQDQSGNGNDAVQTTTGSQPAAVTNVVNGRPVVRFDGVGNNLRLPNVMAAANGGEIFYVLKGTNSGPGSRDYKVSSFGTASTGLKYPQGSGHIADDFGSASAEADQGQPLLALNAWRLYNVSASATQWRTWLDGNPLYSRTGNTVGFRANPVLGQGADGYNWPGDIAEILVYNRPLSDAERNAVGAYLTAKYALDIVPPDAPISLTATVVSANQINLAWASLDQNALYYSIERRVDTGGFVPIATVTAPTTTYSDTNPPAQAIVQYRVRAINPGGSSPYGNVASALMSPNTVNPQDGLPYAIDIALGLDPTASNAGALPATPFPVVPPPPPAPNPNDLTLPVVILLTPQSAVLN